MKSGSTECSTAASKQHKTNHANNALQGTAQKVSVLFPCHYPIIPVLFVILFDLRMTKLIEDGDIMRICLIFITSLLLAIFIGCSGGANQPTVPASDELMPAQQAGEIQILMSGTMNLDDGTVEFNNRTGDFYMDVTPYVGSYFSWEITYYNPPYLTIKMTLTNPTLLTVYDVCIVFDELYGKTVLNPDLYTDIFEPYDINPAIEFRKESPTREFPPLEDTEYLSLNYPGGSALVDFFIIAHLGGNTGGVRDFTTCASVGWFFPGGGSTVETIVWAIDYQNDVSIVVADTTVFTGGFTYLTQDPVYPELWRAEYENTEGAPAGNYPVTVMANSPSTPQYNTYGYTYVRVYNPGDDPTWFGDDIDIVGDDVFYDTNIRSSGAHAIGCDNDHYYLAFAGDDNADEGAIYFTRSRDGDRWDDARPLTDEGNGLKESYPSLVCYKGNVLIAYQAAMGHDFDIMLLASFDYGETWASYNITNSPMSNEISPSICMDTRSGEEVLYVAYIHAETGECVAAGAGLDNPSNWKIGIVSDGGWTLDAELPSIAFNHKTDEIMVCYSDRTDTIINHRIYFSSTKDVTDWPSPVVVTQDCTDTWREIYPSLAINPNTGVPGIAYSYGSYEYSIRFIKATDETGSTFNPPVCVTGDCNNPTYYCRSASLCCEKSSRWLLSWYGGGEFTNSRCWFSESMDDGVEWRSKRKLNDTFAVAYNPVLVSDDENVIVAWADYREDHYEIAIDHGTHR
jgi:hypothetical protein